jgi:hypothetical protein
VPNAWMFHATNPTVTRNPRSIAPQVKMTNRFLVGISC